MDALNDILGHVDEDIVVRTSIDAGLQATAEQALDEELAAKGAKANVSQGALVAMTPQGAVRALIGGRNYGESQYNRAVAARRQPGSAFKAFVYLTALEHGLTPDTIRDDRPINVKGWQPDNYGHEYFGARAAGEGAGAVAQLRVGAADSGNDAGRGGAHRAPARHRLEARAERLDRARHVGGVAAGTGRRLCALRQWRLRGHAACHRPHHRRATARCSTHSRKRSSAASIDPRYVAMMNAMMEQTLTIGTARKASLPGWSAAGKTGTSQDFRDAWFVGYTPHLVTGVWLGNDDGTPTKHITGGSMPVEIWSRVMRAAHQGVPVANLPTSYGESFMSGLFGGGQPAPSSQQGETDGMAPRPPAPIRTTSNQPAPRGGSMDGWLLDNLFGRR